MSELSIASFHHALRNQTTSCTVVTRTYLDRIAQYDSVLKTLICVNQNVLNAAKQKDELTKSLITGNKPFPPLHGVPIFLKDNYSTKDLPTSAGVKALQNLITSQDSEAVARLRAAGAIILAKANLHELALQGTTTSSLGGQTLNPYDLTRTPGGSSGGTAAALAADLGLAGCGTDTMNSLRSPASACSIVGFRPSKGAISTWGIVPVCETQDVAGPMGRTVADVRSLYRVMSDGDTASRRRSSLRNASSKAPDVRIGILDAYFSLEDPSSGVSEALGDENVLVQSIVRKALARIQDIDGITLIPVHPTSDWRIKTLLASADVQAFEFRECLDAFLRSPLISSTPHRSLESIAESADYDDAAVTEVFYLALNDPVRHSWGSEEHCTRLANIVKLKNDVRQCFDKFQIDFMVYPHQRQLTVKCGATKQPNRNGILAALTGNPAICIPGK